MPHNFPTMATTSFARFLHLRHRKVRLSKSSSSIIKIYCLLYLSCVCFSDSTYDQSRFQKSDPPKYSPCTSTSGPTCSSALCPNCTTVANSPQSIFNGDESNATITIDDSSSSFDRSSSLASLFSEDSQQSFNQLLTSVSSPVRPAQTRDLKCKCLWQGCQGVDINNKGLLDHLICVHITSQTRQLQLHNEETARKYVCLWQGCRYFEHESTREWLEGHVLKHTGDKPFQCIWEGCGHRCSSRAQLQRHVDLHLTYDDQVRLARSRPDSKNSKGRRKQKASVRTTRPGLFFACFSPARFSTSPRYHYVPFYCPLTSAGLAEALSAHEVHRGPVCHF